jgi:hypothetical protein
VAGDGEALEVEDGGALAQDHDQVHAQIIGQVPEQDTHGDLAQHRWQPELARRKAAEDGEEQDARDAQDDGGDRVVVDRGKDVRGYLAGQWRDQYEQQHGAGTPGMQGVYRHVRVQLRALRERSEAHSRFTSR